MGYKIVYGKKKRDTYQILPMQTKICMALLFLAVCVRLFWPEARNVVQDFLISTALSDQAVSFSALMQRLEAGEQLGEAVLVFCRELIYESS